MWEMRIARPFGRISTRNLFVFVAGLLAAAFSLALLTTSTAHAAPDVKWSGTDLIYQDNTYTRTNDGAQNDPRGVPYKATVLTYVDVSVSPRKAHYIFFPSSADVNAATEAVYLNADYTPPDTFENISEKMTLAVQSYESQNEETSSCVYDGVGWFICPATDWLAQGMDYLYAALSGFLEVRPAQTDTDNALHRAWSFMRNTANVLFVIGFLIVIYSQVTSFGISNYHIKKMLPRLIAAAILVNISYWICAIAIDISNILGYSIQDVFINMRQNVVGSEGNSWDLISWQSITGVILSGGAGATAAGIGIASFAASAGSSIFMLLPILVGVLMTVLVALLIMAARQALITILLVVSPLAFVAFLLPNTEKYFEKWRSIGVTMLVMFPIFSVIFGGSQIAGVLIIQNADSINLVILGLAVQVAPLIVTPLLIRFSGSLLGRIAGMINNPNKGAVDRTRKWAEERAGQMKSRQLNSGKGFLANRARGFDSRRRKREGWQRSNDSMVEANWGNTADASDIQQHALKAADIKNTGDSNAQAAYNKGKTTNAGLQNIDIKARTAKLDVDLSQAEIEANWEEALANHGGNLIQPHNLALASLGKKLIRTDAESRRAQSAKYMQKKSQTDALLKNTEQIGGKQIRDYIGGAAGTTGAESALAGAVATSRKEYEDRVGEKTQLLRHFNLSSKERQTLAMGKDVSKTKDGAAYTFTASDDYAREAAIDEQLATGSFAQIEEIIMESGMNIVDPKTGVKREGLTSDYATTISSVIMKNKIPNKAVYLGSKTIDDIAQGKVNGKEGLTDAVIYNLVNGKVKDEVLAGMDAAGIKRMFEVGTDPATIAKVDVKDRAAFMENVTAMGHSAHRILENPLLRGSASQSAKDVLDTFKIEP